MKILTVLLLPLVLASCSTVVSVQPVGSKPVDFEKHKLEGIWAGEDGDELALVIKDRKLGTIAMLSGDEEEELLIRQTGGVLFASQKEETQPRYAWVRLRLDGDTLNVDVPDPEQFAALVKKEKVEGRVIEAEEEIDAAGKVIPGGGITVVLDDPKAMWIRKLIDGKLGKPWAKDNKLVLKRVRRIY